ncbi:hypothetical protein H6P81_009041 [Aristolochia fimbriata]|uniref:Uncharacterized protein n=1 Tax=Aristolochia fimbriata TaxID=158543 RepID=A0AAV7EKY3_ARIFI|nr:hypothetical protein H6P81_009041 [Aristolochia fimbriata]
MDQPAPGTTRPHRTPHPPFLYNIYGVLLLHVIGSLFISFLGSRYGSPPQSGFSALRWRQVSLDWWVHCYFLFKSPPLQMDSLPGNTYNPDTPAPQSVTDLDQYLATKPSTDNDTVPPVHAPSTDL